MTRRPLAAALLLPLLLPLLLATPSGPAAATGRPEEMLPDPAQEARARELGRELRCLVCQNQSIEDSDADLARQLRGLVRERIAAGASDGEAREFVHARYGDFVLLRPPVNAGTALLWGTPLLALLGGAAALWAVRRRAATPVAAVPLSPAERERLEALERGGAP